MYLQDVDDVYDLAVVERTSRTARCGTRRSSSSRATRSSWRTSSCTAALFESALAEGWRAAGGRRAGGRACRPTTGRSRARTRSTCSTRAARSRSASAPGMILRIRKLACAIAKAYVESLGGRAEPTRGRAWLSSCSRSASRRCRRPGCRGWPSSCASASRTPPARELLEREGRSRSPGRRGGWCCAAELPARQADREEPVWGPALKVAKDAAGAWTAAAQGFAKKNGVAVDALAAEAEGPGEARRAQPALRQEGRRPRDGRASCPALIVAAAARAGVPQADELGRLARRRQGRLPVRPPDPLAGRAASTAQVVPFTIHALEAGAKGARDRGERRATRAATASCRGTRPRSDRASARSASCSERLRERFVLLDPARRERPRSTRSCAPPRAAARRDDHGLRDEWRDLVEYPTVRRRARMPAGVPRPAARGARDGAGAPPEVRAAARRGGPDRRASRR